MPAATLEPTDARMAAAMLAEAAGRRQPIRPSGSGTKTAWHDQARDAATLSTQRLNDRVQHFAGDLVATLPAGITLAQANRVLAEAGQWLPIDPSFAERATIGGIVAANDSGPRRHKYGAPRDLIVGIELALCDGRLAKAGGRVVKNVAGYDLSRLVCGSFGSLAVITSATFKLAPLPQTSRTIVASGMDAARASTLALEIAAQPVTPSAIEIAVPAGQLLIRFETIERSADHMAASTCAFLNSAGASTTILDGAAEQRTWGSHESSIWDQPGVVVKVSVLPSDISGFFECCSHVARGAEWSAIGRAALGVLLVRVNATERGVLKTLGEYATKKSGTMRILRGAEHTDIPARHGALRELQHAIKAQFDPANILPALPTGL